MKKPSRQRPEVESLESMVLLTTIVSATLTAAARTLIVPAQLIQQASPVPRVQVVGLSGLAAPRYSATPSTSRAVVTGIAITPTLTSQTARRVVVVSTSLLSKDGPTRAPTVHAMIVPGSKPVTINPPLRPVGVVAAPLTGAATQLLDGFHTKGVKVS